MLQTLRTLQPTIKCYAQMRWWKLAGKQPLSPKERTQFINTWGEHSLQKFALCPKIIGKPMQTPGLLVGNHLSYLDILMLAAHVPKISFVAKAEIGKWPVFGFACHTMGMVMIKREDRHSRKQALQAISKAIQEEGKQVVVFPSGTTSLEEGVWRQGTFKMAASEKIPVQAFRLDYSPRRATAFIDDDALLPHLSRLLKSKEPIVGQISFADPVMIQDPEQDSQSLWKFAAQSQMSNKSNSARRAHQSQFLGPS